MEENERRLLFVYNGSTGPFHWLMDISHKLISPKTYPCKLCSLTHGVFSMHPEWRGLIQELAGRCEFRHRDQFITRTDMSDFDLPAIFETDDRNAIQVWMSAQQIAELASTEELIDRVRGYFGKRI